MATATNGKHSKLDHVEINQGLRIVSPDPDQSRKAPNEDIEVDIVAVPGLGANPEWTWRKNKVDWLSDSNMLPRSIPNARIMIFEYESQWFGRGSINQKLSSVADQLVQALSHLRQRGLKRPIIFVCHCLGGIIVEKALISAQLRQMDYPNIINSVVGCIFLGTPFRGTKSQKKATLLAEMAESIGLGVNSGLLKILEEGSEILKDLLSDFSFLARESNMQLFCYFEQHASDTMGLFVKSPLINHKEVVVDESSAHIDGYRSGGLGADHFGLNKFTGPKDGMYISVSGEINAMVKTAARVLRSRQNAIRQTLVDDGTYQTILEELKATDPQKDLQDSLRGRPVDQASWALSNENYTKWQEAKDSQVLWIHGDAGKGQPVIACSIMQHLQEQVKQTEGVFLAYFFCDEKDSHRRTVRDVLKLLIRQMIWKNRDLAENLLVDEGTGKKGGRKPQNFDTISLAALWSSLQNMLSDSSVENVFFIVNALDETDKESRKEFLSYLEPYLKLPLEKKGDDETIVKWLFLSRSGRPDIESSLTKALVICMEDKENAGFINDGVKQEISGQVDELAQQKNFNDALKYLIKRYVYTKADGNYIYAHLVVQELKNLDSSQTNVSLIRKYLEDLPYGLTDMFEFTRQRVLSPRNEGIEYTKEILRCLILAEESPSLYELALIADLPCEVRDNEDALKGYIRRCGAFLLTNMNEEGDELVEWIDVIAKEHLRTYAKGELTLALSDVQHGVIALRCLEHVRSAFAVKPLAEDDEMRSLEQAKTPPHATEDGNAGAESQNESRVDADTDTNDTVNHSTNDATERPQKQDLSRNDVPGDTSLAQPEDSQDGESLLGYAVNYWLEHAMQAPIDVVEELDLNDEFWAEESSTRDAWWTEYSEETKHAGVTGIKPLHLAALTGYSSLLTYLLEHGRIRELHKADSWGYTPLSWACDYGDISLVDRILKAGADVNHPAENGGPSALWVAAYCSYIDIVQYLLEHGAEVNWQDETRGTPLYIAIYMKSTDIVRELLRHGADVNLKGGWHIRPLNVAAYHGLIEVVQSLLEHGIEVDSDDEYRYGSALGAAARKGYADIVHLLLQKGWDVNQKIKTYNSPLVAAATYGHAEVVQVLLEFGTEGASEVQALESASKNGRTDVVKSLLAHKPHLPHHKAFHNAATQGRDDILGLLEKRGTNAELLNTALYDASDQERESTVNLLLKFGADPNAEGKEYGNALQAAAFDGSTGIVESLLAHKANVNQQGGDYGTALQAAALFGHEDIAEKLLDHGAYVDTDEPVGRFGSALQAACSSQNTNLVELLINHGANVNACGGMYGSPIMAAVYESMQINVNILVKCGANVNVKHVKDKHAPLLVMAGYTLGKEQLELLLDHGADIEGIDDDGTTVLIAAADSGDKESVEMLLARGANIHTVSKTFGTALSAAASESDEECLRVLLDHGGDPNQDCGEWGTALQAAADTADLDCINMLLAAGADVNKGNAENGYPLPASASSGNTVCLQRLLEAGANVNVVGSKAGSALAEAASAGHVECLKILLKHGADVNLHGGTYHCALQAACARQNNFECVKTLLEQGADTHLDGGLYGSVMQAAAFGQNVDLMDLLLEHGAEVDNKGGKYGNALQAAALKEGNGFVLRLLDLQVEVNDVSGKYSTALQAAASANDAETVSLLLQHGANPQLGGGLYGNALNAAASRGSIDVLNHLLEQALPSGMLDGALLRAVLFRYDEAVNVLLKKGASVEAREAELGSPFELLQKSPEVDANSDIAGDEDDEDDEEDSSDEEDEDENEGSDTEDDSSVNNGTDDGASIVDLQLEDPSTAESKIRKYLEDARTKIRRNPTLRRPAVIQRKPVSSTRVDQIPGSTAQYDAYGVTKPQQLDSTDGTYQISSDYWRKNLRTQDEYSYQAPTYGQAAPVSAASSEYAAYSCRPPATHAYDSYSHEPLTGTASSDSYQANGYSHPQAFPHQEQVSYVSPAQSPSQVPPKAPTYGNITSLPGTMRLSPSSLNMNTTVDLPPRIPPRPQPANGNYQAYAHNTQQSSPYQTLQAYQTPQPYQNPPKQTYPPPRQHQPPARTPPAQPPYAAYPLPSQYTPQQQSQSSVLSGSKPPPMPPRPSPAQNQSSDALDFDRLQQKAQKFAGRFWK